MSPACPLQDAKNRLSELIDSVLKQGAQTITRHGKPVAVVISAEDFERLQPQETLAEILLDCPVKDWMPERDRSPAPDMDFDGASMAYLIDANVLCESNRSSPGSDAAKPSFGMRGSSGGPQTVSSSLTWR